MQRIHPLHVALKDRPKIFQAIVLCLFSSSVLAIVICGIYALQAEAKPSTTVQKQAKPPATQAAYASFSR